MLVSVTLKDYPMVGQSEADGS
jgi:RhoGEF domain